MGFELTQLYRATPNANTVFLDLLARSDALLSTGACKLLYIIVEHLYATGKLLAKSETKQSNSKIQVISTASSASSIDTDHGILLNEIAFIFLDKLFAEIRDPKPTLRSVIFADTVTLLFQVMCVTLNGGLTYLNVDSKLREQLDEKDELLIDKLNKLVPQFVSSMLTWYSNSRPLYRSLCREMLRRMTAKASESLKDLGSLVFGDFLELTVIEAGLDNLPVSRYLEALEAVVTTSSDWEAQWFLKVMHFGLLISKPPVGVRESMLAPLRDRIVKCMCSTFQKAGVKRETVEIAVSVLEFAGLGKFDFDAWFWTQLSQVELSTIMGTHEPLVSYFVSLERKKEMRVAMLNLLLQGWSKAGSPAPLTTNCRSILLFILRNPHASADLFQQLNAYVQKNAALDKIQKLVADSLQSN